VLSAAKKIVGAYLLREMMARRAGVCWQRYMHCDAVMSETLQSATKVAIVDKSILRSCLLHDAERDELAIAHFSF